MRINVMLIGLVIMTASVIIMIVKPVTFLSSSISLFFGALVLCESLWKIAREKGGKNKDSLKAGIICIIAWIVLLTGIIFQLTLYFRL